MDISLEGICMGHLGFSGEHRAYYGTKRHFIGEGPKPTDSARWRPVRQRRECAVERTRSRGRCV